MARAFKTRLLMKTIIFASLLGWLVLQLSSGRGLWVFVPRKSVPTRATENTHSSNSNTSITQVKQITAKNSLLDTEKHKDKDSIEGQAKDTNPSDFKDSIGALDISEKESPVSDHFDGDAKTPSVVPQTFKPMPNCTDVFQVRQPQTQYSGRRGTLSSSEVAVYVMISKATADRYFSGPYKKWTELKDKMSVHLFIPQFFEEIPEAIPVNVGERTDHSISDFSMASLEQIYDMHPTKKWFLKLDDDAYLFVPNLLHALANLDPTKPIIGGRVFYEHTNSVSGGAGYFMSNSVMKAVSTGSNSCYTKGDLQGAMEDILIQDCARKQFGDTLQVLSIPGMYPFTLEQTKVNHWGGSPEGLVDYPITFHYIRSTEETSQIHDCRLSR